MEEVQEIFLQIPSQRKIWQDFLEQQGIKNFSEQELSDLTKTLGIFESESGKLLATGSFAGSTLKYLAATSENEIEGKRFNRLVTELINRQVALGNFHSFVFTKPNYLLSFQSLGFRALAESDMGILLERGRPGIEDYLQSLPKSAKSGKIAAIVMNANPFTLGHRYLAERAAFENDWLYVFVVSTDKSLFRTDERLMLIRQGLSDLPNVTVVSGGDYLISYTTFPAYFIDEPDAIIRYQTTIDARLFKNWIAASLGITSRYVGTEPLSHTTALYNESLLSELPPEITVKILPRQTVNGQLITATATRQAIADGQLEKIKNFLPETTYEFIASHLTDLQKRIERGQKINGN